MRNALKVAFRTDASIDIGTGHVMRCLTLADALAERGAECVFLCRPHKGHLLDLIATRGFRALAMPEIAPADLGLETQNPPHAPWLGTSWHNDARDSMAALREFGKVDWLIVDHYALDARWEKAMRTSCAKLMVIDDLADRPHDCDLLLDQNLGRQAADYVNLVPSTSEKLIGPRYALLRPEFARMRAASLARRKIPKLQKLLITMGGVDKDNATGKVLDALVACKLPDTLEITVILGLKAPWLDSVRAQAAKMPFATKVLMNVQDMAVLMSESDLAIGAGGGTTWERCSLGVASVVIETAANQNSGAKAMIDAGAALSLKPIQSPEFAASLCAVLTETANLTILGTLSKIAVDVCDGDGVERVVDLLYPPKCLFRDALRDDSQRVWDWRQTTNQAFNLGAESTSFKSHDDWFDLALKRPDCLIRILMIRDLPFGYLRLDPVSATCARVSVCLSTEVQGKGFGKDLLTEAVRIGKKLAIKRLDAEIHPDNIASRRLFVSAGYREQTGLGGFLTFHRDIEKLQ